MKFKIWSFGIIPQTLTLIPLMIISCSIYSKCVIAQTNPVGFKPHRSVPVIELKGNSYERGVVHGQKLKAQIAQVYTKWKAQIRNAAGGDPDSVITAFLKAGNFEANTRKYTPWLLKELIGISDGSGQAFKDVFAFQLVDEFWVYLDRKFNNAYHHCSSIGVPGRLNHPAYLAQNIDIENFRAGYQVLFHISASKTEPEQFIVSCAGMVALIGMNDKGIGVCVNSLMELQASADGLPVAFVVRGLLNKQSGSEAISFIKSVNHASGQNYLVGIPDTIFDFEASCTQVIRFLPKAGPDQVICHTNHALANQDIKAWYNDYHLKMVAGKTSDNNSEVRLATLEKQLNKPPDQISAAIIRSTLRSKENPQHPVCRKYSESAYGFTFSSVLFTLDGKRSVQLTCGPPDQSEYREYFFKTTSGK